MTWRTTIASQIAAVVRSAEYQALADPKDRRKLLGERYPYGPRKMLPYKVWNEEANAVVYGTRHPRKREEQQERDERGGLFAGETETPR